MDAPAANVLVLSTADWEAPLWTNKQHVAQQLAVQTRVTYVESVGLRRPTFSSADIRRVWRRVRSLFAGRHAKRQSSGSFGRTNIVVIQPNVIPLHGFRLVDYLNGVLLRRQVCYWRRSSTSPRVLWTYSPITFGLEAYADFTVYHCVDFIGDMVGVNKKLLGRRENELFQTADLTYASSSPLYDHALLNGARNVRLIENVADVELYGGWTGDQRERRALFAGNLLPEKVDFKLLQEVVDAGLCDVHIAGTVRAEHLRIHPDLKALLADPRVNFHGVLDPAALAKLAQTCEVGLIPYHQTAYTAGVFPMKVYEYMSAGLAVVSTDLRSLVGVPEVVAVPREQFSKAVERELAMQSSDLRQRKRDIALAHSWTARGIELREDLQRLVRTGSAGAK